MADDPTTETAPPCLGRDDAPCRREPVPAAYLQLTQARVPLDDAGEAFTVPDDSGRLPIVVLPKQPFRIRNEFVIAGVVAIVARRSSSRSTSPSAAGSWASARCRLPGRLPVVHRAGAGRRTRTAAQERPLLPDARGGTPCRPAVDRRLARRDRARDPVRHAGAAGSRRGDDVRVDVDVLMTFTIDAPEKFVFAISAPDFDQVCQAAGARRGPRARPVQALRRDPRPVVRRHEFAPDRHRCRPRGRTASKSGASSSSTSSRPLEFMASRESRRLASVRATSRPNSTRWRSGCWPTASRSTRQRVAAQRERIELEAANEALRLEHLESRLAAYPNAARRDLEEQRIEVARALAGNTRAMVQVGSSADVADALIMHTLTDAPRPAPPSATRDSTGRRSSPWSTWRSNRRASPASSHRPRTWSWIPAARSAWGPTSSTRRSGRSIRSRSMGSGWTSTRSRSPTSDVS